MKHVDGNSVMGVANRDIELFNLYTKEQCKELISWFHSEEDKGNTLTQTYERLEDIPNYVNGNRVPTYARVRYLKHESLGSPTGPYGKAKVPGGFEFTEAYFPQDHPYCIDQFERVQHHGRKNGVKIKSMIGLVIQRYVPGGYVGWHCDRAPSHVNGEWQQMMYSTSCQLGDDYEGGGLVFGTDAFGREKIYDCDDIDDYNFKVKEGWKQIKPFFHASKEVGHGLMYTSDRWHQTQTITSGVRYALLGWFNGDALDGLKRIPRVAIHEDLNEMGWTYDNTKNT